MKKHPVSTVISLCAVLLLAACDSDQGPSPAINQPATAMGGQKREIQPAPESKSYTDKKDVFQGAEYDPGAGWISRFWPPMAVAGWLMAGDGP